MNNVSTLRLPSFPSLLTMKWRFNLRGLSIFSFALLALFTFLYILQLNNITRASFLLADLGKQKTALTEENKKMEAQIARFGSSANLEAILMGLNYEKTGKISYIRILEDTALAKPQ